MTSVDSGVETGNDSNDSSVTHENNIAGVAAGSNIGNNVVNPDHVGPLKPVVLPIASIPPGVRFYNPYLGDRNRSPQAITYYDPNPITAKFESMVPVSIIEKLQNPHSPNSITTTATAVTNNTDTLNTSLPSTSGPLVLHASAEPTKVLEFRIPPTYIESSYGYSRRGTCAIMEEAMNSSKYRNKMRRADSVRRDMKYKIWYDVKGVFDRRRMRLAAATNNIEMMRLLLANGVHPNNYDDQGRSPLHLASSRGYTDMVRLLLEHGADPNHRDCLGNTPLHLATVTSKIAVVTLLLKAGTDVLSSDHHGHNPLQLAQAKLRLLQDCSGSHMDSVREEVHNIVSMLLAYLQTQTDAKEQVEALSSICSRLSLSNTSDQIQGDVRDLLANIDSLSLAS